MNQKTILIYDEQCPLCKRFKQALETLDTKGNFAFYDANEENTYNTFPDLDEQECLRVAHLITKDGQIIVGADIITELVKEYPGVQKFAWLLETDIGKKVNNFFYSKLEQLRKKSLKNCPGCQKNHTYR